MSDFDWDSLEAEALEAFRFAAKTAKDKGRYKEIQAGALIGVGETLKAIAALRKQRLAEEKFEAEQSEGFQGKKPRLQSIGSKPKKEV